MDETAAAGQPVEMGPGLGAAFLGLSGLLLAGGGLAHPHVPVEPTAQMEIIASDAWWLRSHWALTLAQPLAIPGIFLLADRLRGDRRAAGLWSGAVLTGLGLFVGTLGTLSAATGLPAAAKAGATDLYGTVNAFTLGLGWLCVALSASGALVFGARIMALHDGRGARTLGGVLAGFGVVLLVVMASISPDHPWTHDLLLRASAVLAGLLMAVTAGWLATIPPEGVPPGNS